jgi:hypothetical protein
MSEVTLIVYGQHQITDVTVNSYAFVEELQALIHQVLKVSKGRQQLFFHGPRTLVEMHSETNLSEYCIQNGDFVTCYVREREWEDGSNSEDEKPATHHSNEASLSQQLQDSLDQAKLDELMERYDDARAQIRNARADALCALKRVKEFEETHQHLKRRKLLLG